MDFNDLLTVFFSSWQVKTLAGLILLDVILGIASAMKAGEFQWAVIANFYRTMVVPYVLGYLALYVAINYIIPPDILDGLGDEISLATVTLAWGALAGNLLASITRNLKALYQPITV